MAGPGRNNIVSDPEKVHSFPLPPGEWGQPLPVEEPVAEQEPEAQLDPMEMIATVLVAIDEKLERIAKALEK